MSNNNISDKSEDTYYKTLQEIVLFPEKEKYRKFLLEDTEDFVMNKLKDVSKTQMRNIFDLLTNCTSPEEMRFTKPKLIYTAGRLNGNGKKFVSALSKIVVKVKDDKDEKNKDVSSIHKYIETVLAYHKYYAK